ncbi:hypothetical protein D9756_008630 [Leucocoprinus leucothites]|uniref:Trafficking protein particle complex II-specific subunit 65 IgD3 domain-containing protein n=1 Tax=Leucocoprinus leucothites TaxID=201217 RepID=A0A8H5CZW4_9AGAR|nr:hypothetical protein D9756_008630 [Leucoagaricus leucothites]
MSLEHLFSTSVLSLSVPDTSVEFPPTDPPDEWLETLTSNLQERKQAFFDEQLQSLLTLRVEHPTPYEPADPSHPPAPLITFLAHVQVSLEASYISSVPTSVETPQAARLSLPPRTASLGGFKPSTRGGAHHPSILPPSTPNPTPATADHDRKYVASQGTLLFTNIWGQSTADDSQEAFTLVWSERENVWVAVYRLALTVSFLRLTFADPLLCLTISATLREKPVTMSSTNHPFIRFMKAFDGVVIPESPTITDKVPTQDESDNLDGFEEVNLLEGLLAGPTFSKMAPEINLPSTRLGTASRQKLFSLPPVSLPSPGAPSPSPVSAALGRAQSTLRKSFRKTLETVSGFRVRMRTVFVPSVVLDASQEEHDKMASGNEERTVVLCVEIENSGESGNGIGFEVEKVDVVISGDEAKATLITWGRLSFTAQDDVFPLRIAQSAQYNLLYAVTFLRSPEELDAFSFARKTVNTTHTDLQRAVSINIHGKPYVKAPNSATVIYPTRTFSSKWNCVLDLASHQPQNLRNLDPSDPSTAYPSVLPEPPSPFPVFGLQTSKPSPTTANLFSSTTPTATVSDAAKGGQLMAGRILKSSTPRMSAVPMSAQPSRMSLPAQVAPNTTYAHSPTTYSAPPHRLQLDQLQQHHPHERPYSYTGLPPSRTHTPPVLDTPTPVTPAYPAFPPRSSNVPPTPMSHAPVVSQMSGGVVGPSLEARRGRGVGVGEPPNTPVPHPHTQLQQQQFQYGAGHGPAGNERGMVVENMDGGDAVVVSVGLLNVIKSGGVGRHKKPFAAVDDDEDDKQEEETDSASASSSSPPASEADETSDQGSTGPKPELGVGKIYPLDLFTLDIFVFNKSERTRRFEISYVERRRRRKGGAGVADESGGVDGSAGTARKMGYPGIMPMEGRVRIGPLLPSACQSVRMEFLAVSPGVHSIEALTLTDIESGHSINLRSVMDIVVHKPDD